MTTTASGRQRISACDGVTVAFSCPQFRKNAELQVWLLDSATQDPETGTLLSEGANYSITGSPIGGTATVNTSIAYPVGKYLCRKRVTSRAQNVDVIPNAAVPAATQEDALDRLSMVDEELAADLADLAAIQVNTPRQVQDLLFASLVPGPNITLSQAIDGPITIAAPTISYSDEQARDAIGLALQGGSGISVAVDDAANVITITCTVPQYTDEQARDAIGACLVAGANVSLTVNDAANTITIDAAGGGGGTDPEVVRDTMATALIAGAGIAITVDDPANTITIASSITQYSDEMARDALGLALVAGAGISIAVNDPADTITITSSITQYSDEMARDALGVALVAAGGMAITVNDPADTITIDGSAFGPKFLGPTSSSTAITLTDADNNTIRKLTGAVTRTITADGSLTAGFSCVLWNLGTINQTLSCPSGVYKNGATASAATGTLAPGAQITLIHYGSGVFIASGQGLT